MTIPYTNLPNHVYKYCELFKFTCNIKESEMDQDGLTVAKKVPILPVIQGGLVTSQWEDFVSDRLQKGLLKTFVLQQSFMLFNSFMYHITVQDIHILRDILTMGCITHLTILLSTERFYIMATVIHSKAHKRVMALPVLFY